MVCLIRGVWLEVIFLLCTLLNSALRVYPMTVGVMDTNYRSQTGRIEVQTNSMQSHLICINAPESETRLEGESKKHQMHLLEKLAGLGHVSTSEMLRQLKHTWVLVCIWYEGWMTGGERWPAPGGSSPSHILPSLSHSQTLYLFTEPIEPWALWRNIQWQRIRAFYWVTLYFNSPL